MMSLLALDVVLICLRTVGIVRSDCWLASARDGFATLGSRGTSSLLMELARSPRIHIIRIWRTECLNTRD